MRRETKREECIDYIIIFISIIKTFGNVYIKSKESCFPLSYFLVDDEIQTICEK